MNMTNFMPWRQQRRVRCLRFWAVAFAATLLLVLMVFFSLRMNNVVKLRALQSELMGTQSVQHALASRQRQTTAGPIPAIRPQRLTWQPVLESLSDVIPPEVWLTELRYQPPSLMLIGYATSLPALSVLRDALRQIAGFTSGPAGELQQDRQGRWMFTFQLKSQG